MNPAFFPIFPSLVYDSFVTIGLETNVGNAMLDIGIDFTAFEAGGAISTDNGSWFATPDDAQVNEVNGQVLIGQFTIADDGVLTGQVNLQGKNADGSNWTATAVAFSGVIPAPGAIALLGLAGITAQRPSLWLGRCLLIVEASKVSIGYRDSHDWANDVNLGKNATMRLI